MNKSLSHKISLLTLCTNTQKEIAAIISTAIFKLKNHFLLGDGAFL
jgi:hypothetical protein